MILKIKLFDVIFCQFEKYLDIFPATLGEGNVSWLLSLISISG